MLSTQSIMPVSEKGDALYLESFLRMRGLDGRIADTPRLVQALEAIGAAPVLDRYVLKLALDRLEADPDVTIGCNLSTQNLSDAAHWTAIMDQIRSRRRLASRLVLEITESQPWPADCVASDMLREARKLGCRIVLDDFGSHYSTPALLLDIEFDAIKIDKAFLADVRRNRSGQTSLAHLVRFAACFSQHVVVEGVETREQLELCREAGASHVQGYMFGRPAIQENRRAHCVPSFLLRSEGLAEPQPVYC